MHSRWLHLLMFIAVSAAHGCIQTLRLHEVHNSSWSGSQIRQFALSSISQAGDVLQCIALAVKHLLTDQQLLVFIPGDATPQQKPQCIVASRHGALCRVLLPSQTRQPPDGRIRAFVTSLSDCWISIQRRVDSSLNFNRNWSDYAIGFGEGPHTNHWLGLRIMYSLTWPSGRALRMRMRLWNDTEYWADYSSFIVASEADMFHLSVAGFHGNHSQLYDCMRLHKGYNFSTADRGESAVCSSYFKSGWWFTNCYYCNPNGPYYYPPEALRTSGSLGIVWLYPFGGSYSMKEFEMLVLW